MQQLDKRVWNPDETCMPFHLESTTAAGAIVDQRFTVPRGMVAVITSVATLSGAGLGDKSSNNVINIVRGGIPITATNLLTDSAFIEGAMTEVYEGQDAGSPGVRSVPGFACTTIAFTRPCRVILEPGSYQAVHSSAGGYLLVLDGYMFPDVTHA